MKKADFIRGYATNQQPPPMNKREVLMGDECWTL
jgi:hypothetical protein